ncbi:hypothetical protein J6590_057216 [Homalodisca vitripennis]|nr:hypothetical protein J6590_057216 [Homalodisca vitripennis]
MGDDKFFVRPEPVVLHNSPYGVVLMNAPASSPLESLNFKLGISTSTFPPLAEVNIIDAAGLYYECIYVESPFISTSTFPPLAEVNIIDAAGLYYECIYVESPFISTSTNKSFNKSEKIWEPSCIFLVSSSGRPQFCFVFNTPNRYICIPTAFK